MRDKLAEIAAKDDDGSGGMSLEKVQAWVQDHMRSLRLVPWQLDKPVGQKPACSTCPHNSVNDRGLFEHDEEQPAETGVCLNEPCFEAKTRACEQVVAAAAKKAEVLNPGSAKETYTEAKRAGAKLCHPDAGGSRERFMEFNENNRVLDEHFGRAA